MSYLREYIRHCLFEEGTQAFGEYPLMYNPQTVIFESNILKNMFFDLVEENMQLAYFNKDSNNEVNGAAWVHDDGGVFKFSITGYEETPRYVLESLIMDCMEEYLSLKSENPKLKLEARIDDEELENYLSEIYGLSIISENKNMSIMGFGS